MSKKLLDAAEVAKLLNVRQTTLGEWRYLGIGPKWRKLVNDQYPNICVIAYDRDAVLQYQAEQSEHGDEPPEAAVPA